ncbi:MAG: hypothetical protein DWQ10_14745 [Calditrichaeota bacterium]|nr:MAG: hypothetical protein DWQ10_14745 [Calditrichota bacterium]
MNSCIDRECYSPKTICSCTGMNRYFIYFQLIGFTLLLQVYQLSHVHLSEYELTRDILHNAHAIVHAHDHDDDADHHHDNNKKAHHHDHNELHVNADQFYLLTANQQLTKREASDHFSALIPTSRFFPKYKTSRSPLSIQKHQAVEWHRMPSQGRSPPISA